MEESEIKTLDIKTDVTSESCHSLRGNCSSAWKLYKMRLSTIDIMDSNLATL